MFGKKNKDVNTTTSTTGSSGAPYQYSGYDSNGKKFKPYRNRPSIRQALLEILSFCLILAAAPAFLGGTISIFICYFTLVLGLIGLFAWTRRHAALFALLALCIIAACVINIILRATFHGDDRGQCLPYFHYSNQFNGNGQFINSGDNNNNGLGNNNSFNNSIWCGNRYVVYITNAIILLLAIPAMIIALTLLCKRRRANNNVQNTGYKHTETTTTRSVATA